LKSFAQCAGNPLSSLSKPDRSPEPRRSCNLQRLPLTAAFQSAAITPRPTNFGHYSTVSHDKWLPLPPEFFLPGFFRTHPWSSCPPCWLSLPFLFHANSTHPPHVPETPPLPCFSLSCAPGRERPIEKLMSPLL